jgi:hypothetical protein
VSNTYRKTATTIGLIYLAGMVVGIAGNSVIQSILATSDHLSMVSANSLLLAMSAMLMMLAAIGDAAHGILMLPVLRPHGERLAFGYLGGRLIDALLFAVGVLFLLLQLPLGREYLTAAASDRGALQALSTLTVQAHQYSYEISMMTLSIASLLLTYTLFRARLVPRVLAAWGLVGYVSLLVGSVLGILGFNLNLVHVIPGGLWEVFIGFWLVAKGFSTARAAARQPVTAGPARKSATEAVPAAA